MHNFVLIKVQILYLLKVNAFSHSIPFVSILIADIISGQKSNFSLQVLELDLNRHYIQLMRIVVK